ncbi:hypothetical protein EJB05_37779 [Eragrostis curvula]|uniref:Peptidase A1 domain-containing protein n=1 Tax=Eragrostis curvula TaxID=38414 RepID=A0A5J9TU24_9POAL|nr:hypothetical protein EJB05_37779 [Eragrostis curvula]
MSAILLLLFLALPVLPARCSSPPPPTPPPSWPFHLELARVDALPGANLTDHELLRRAVQRSLERAGSVVGAANADGGRKASVEAPLGAGGGEYLVKLGVGTPQHFVSAAIDTATDLVWMQCQPCVSCYRQFDPVFNPKLSSSFAVVPCGSDTCDQLDEHRCRDEEDDNACQYTYKYSGNAVTKGTLAMDKLAIAGNVFHAVVFGCSDSSVGGPPPQASGLVGLGRGPLSLVSQLSVRRFMYCLPPPLSRTAGRLVLGVDADAVRNATDRVAVTMSSNPRYPSYYYLNLDGLAVGDRTPRRLTTNRNATSKTAAAAAGAAPGAAGDRANAHGMIVDIASTITFLEASLYEELVDDLEEEIRLPRGMAFSRGIWNVATISRVKGSESGKSCRILPISTPQGRKHSVIIQGVNAEKTKNIDTKGTVSNIETDSTEKTKNDETRGTISEVIDEDERSDKDTCRTTAEVIDGNIRGRNTNITGCKEHQRRTIKDQTAKIIVSEDEEVSDDEKYFPFSNVLARSRHRDGSIYRGMDLWWKEEYHIANRNEMYLSPFPTAVHIDFRHHKLRLRPSPSRRGAIPPLSTAPPLPVAAPPSPPLLPVAAPLRAAPPLEQAGPEPEQKEEQEEAESVPPSPPLLLAAERLPSPSRRRPPLRSSPPRSASSPSATSPRSIVLLDIQKNGARLEAMMLSHPTGCSVRDGFCRQHYARRMLQIFSLELAEICLDMGLFELYGYIAVRDGLDPLLNYVVNISRDDPIIVEQGFLINMIGPKRGITLLAPILIEYDMRIKRGEQEEDDLQLIDGVTIMGTEGPWDQPYTMRIPGDCGVIGINLSRINYALEATIEVHISEVQSRFSLSLLGLTSGLDKEIWLFNGAITQSRSLKRSVVAVVRNSLLDLKFEVGTSSPTSDKYCCCFKAKTHGHDTQNIKTYFALISVKVTWSTLPSYFPRPRD